MFAVKPLYSSIVIKDLPTTMYTAKNYNFTTSDSSVSSQEDQEKIAELNRQQQAQFRRLTKLQEKLNELCEDLKLDHLITKFDSSLKITSNKKNEPNQLSSKNESTAAKANSTPLKSFDDDPVFNDLVKNMSQLTIKKNKTPIEDIVISVDPSNIPYSIFVQIQQLAAIYKCFVSFHVHGSLSQTNNTVKNLTNLFSGLNLNLKGARASYDYCFTVIFKNLESSKSIPTLSGKSTIYGEANILRYLNGLSSSADNHSKLSLDKKAVADDWIDKCTNSLKLAFNDKTKPLNYLKALNEHLGKSKFLSHDSAKSSLADVYNWSSIQQCSANVPKQLLTQKNIADWSNRVETSNPLLKLFKSI